MTMDLATLSAELFEPWLGSRFLLQGADGLGIEATLLKCPVRPSSTMPGAARTAFSLVLTAPAAQLPSFKGGDVTVRHAQMAPFGPVYVERIFGGTPDTALLQIVFN